MASAEEQELQELQKYIENLKPVDVPGEQTPELYLGLRQEDNTYDGSRIFFDHNSFEFGIFAGTFHARFHLWRLIKAKGQPKGVHQLLSVDSEKYLTFAEVEVEDPQEQETDRQVDFLTEEELERFDSEPHLFDLLMDTDNNVLVRVHGTNFYLCADIEQGAIDFCSPEEFRPAKFVLTIPRSNIQSYDLQLLNLKQETKVIKEEQKSLQNKDDKEKEMKISPQDQAAKPTSPSSVDVTTYTSSVQFDLPKASQGSLNYQVGIEQDYLEVNLNLATQGGGSKAQKDPATDTARPCLFIMGPKQEYEAPMNPVMVKVAAFTSKNYRTSLVSNNMNGEFRLNLTLQGEPKPISINGQVKILDHQFKAVEFQKRADCCSCNIF